LSDILDITDKAEFDALVEKGPVVVDFWADWCGPCHRFAPHFKTAAAKSDLTFVKVDVESAPWAFDEGFSHIPTVRLYTTHGHTDIESRAALPLLAEISNLV
jgi:thiol-disulfide isomerase/thioredoxin